MAKSKKAKVTRSPRKKAKRVPKKKTKQAKKKKSTAKTRGSEREEVGTESIPSQRSNKDIPVTILGDLQIDNVLLVKAVENRSSSENSSPDTSELNWERQKRKHIVSVRRPGGIWLLEKIFQKGMGLKNVKAFPECIVAGPIETGGEGRNQENPNTESDAQDEQNHNRFDSRYCPESVAKLSAYLKSSDDNFENVYRLDDPTQWVYRKEPYKKDTCAPNSEEPIKNACEWTERICGDFNSNSYRFSGITLLWDRGNGFRNLWESSAKNGEKARKIFSTYLKNTISHKGHIVWQRSGPLDQESDILWNVMFKDEELKAEKVLEHTTMIVRSECLQRAGVNISVDSSLEHAVESVVESLDIQPLASLRKCRHLVIWLQHAAIILCKDDPENVQFVFCPNAVDEINSMTQGFMSGYTLVFTAALVKGLLSNCAFDDRESEEDRINLENKVKNAGLHRGIRLGTVLSAAHRRRGYATKREVDRIASEEISEKKTSVESANYPEPYVGLFKRGLCDEVSEQYEGSEGDQKWRRVKEFYLLSEVSFPISHARKNRLSRLDFFIQKKKLVTNSKLLSRFVDIAREGFNKHCRLLPSPIKHDDVDWFPEIEIICPFARFGDILTADRVEIEQYMSVYTLIQSYFLNRESKKPFSIATFGPPGSGKSFAIKAIVESIDPESVRTPLEFNVAQFNKIDDLASAFHHIHDRVMSGITPLVIFDEFDSTFGEQKLGWLKYLLAPMQDGLFKDGQTMYQVGRAVFLFAGGTSSTFEEFRDQMGNEAFIASKGPDFVSRLRGYFNVQSINSEKTEVDEYLMFRRALLLRSIMLKKLKKLVDGEAIAVDEDIVKALLKIPQFHHGIRSMEAIFEMSKNPKQKMEKSDLPGIGQLQMHVDGETFWQH